MGQIVAQIAPAMSGQRPDTPRIQLALAAVTGNHQPHGLKNAFVSCSSGGCKIKVKMLADFRSY